MPRYKVPRLCEVYRGEGGRRDASALDMLPLVLVLGRGASVTIHFGGNDLKSHGVLAIASALICDSTGGGLFARFLMGRANLLGVAMFKGI